MFAFCHEFSMQTAGFGDGFEQWEIYVEPVETVSLNVFVNHLIIHFTIVGTIQIDVETSVFIFVDIFEVGGIDKNLSALVEQSLETVEEGREVFYFPSNASRSSGGGWYQSLFPDVHRKD